MTTFERERNGHRASTYHRLTEIRLIDDRVDAVVSVSHVNFFLAITQPLAEII